MPCSKWSLRNTEEGRWFLGSGIRSICQGTAIPKFILSRVASLCFGFLWEVAISKQSPALLLTTCITQNGATLCHEIKRKKSSLCLSLFFSLVLVSSILYFHVCVLFHSTPKGIVGTYAEPPHVCVFINLFLILFSISFKNTLIAHFSHKNEVCAIGLQCLYLPSYCRHSEWRPWYSRTRIHHEIFKTEDWKHWLLVRPTNKAVGISIKNVAKLTEVTVSF